MHKSHGMSVTFVKYLFFCEFHPSGKGNKRENKSRNRHPEEEWHGNTPGYAGYTIACDSRTDIGEGIDKSREGGNVAYLLVMNDNAGCEHEIHCVSGSRKYGKADNTDSHRGLVKHEKYK